MSETTPSPVPEQTEREALIWALFDHSPYYAVGHLGCNCDCRKWDADHVADALLAAGWSRHPRPATVSEPE